MASVRRLQTQTESFWRDEYMVSEADMDVASGLIIDAGKPQDLGTMAGAIIVRRYQREREALARQAKSGVIYQPMGHFEVGQQLVFSAREFAIGRVLATRPGNNPKMGPFSVIRVAFEGAAPEREYAADYVHTHPLNRPAEELLGGTDAGISEAELVRLFGHYVARKLEPALRRNQEYVPFDDRWFLRTMLPDVHVGYLNVAEAMIDQAGRPLSARAMLGDLGLSGKASEEQLLFALNHALAADSRFDNVTVGEETTWYLRALQPAAIFERPALFKGAFRAEGGEYLGLTMLDLVEEIGDELDDIETVGMSSPQGYQFEITFPHLYAGTMPATSRFLRQLPATTRGHLRLVMVDSRTNRSFQAWAVPQEHYICGMGEWYDMVEMCVGGQIAVSPTADPLTFALAVTLAKGKRREWVRSASVDGGRLVLRMQQAALAVRSDRNMAMDIPDRAAIAALMLSPEQSQASLGSIVRAAMEEQAKLSTRGGTVHAKSLYATVNLLRRSGAVPVFAELTRRACYDPVGDGFWAYDAALEGVVYSSPEDMRQRPRSRRQDLIRDQVAQYLGR